MYKKELSRFIADRVKEFRNERDMTQEQLAEKIGVGQSQITRIEGGEQNISTYRLYTVCKALSVNIGDMFKGFK